MDADEYRLMDETEDAMWWYRALHARLATALAPVRGRVLDAGCGTGGLLSLLRRTRSDLDLTGLEYAKAAAIRASQKSASPIACGSVNTMPFAGASFDAVVTADVLCHAAVHPASALAECHRVLRPGGLLVINMPAYTWLTSAHDRRVHNARRVTPTVLRTWLQRGQFENIQIGCWNALLFPVMVAQRKLLARGDHASDVARLPPWLDATLHAISRIEQRLSVAWPFGGSVIATATRPISSLSPVPGA